MQTEVTLKHIDRHKVCLSLSLFCAVDPKVFPQAAPRTVGRGKTEGRTSEVSANKTVVATETRRAASCFRIGRVGLRRQGWTARGVGELHGTGGDGKVWTMTLIALVSREVYLSLVIRIYVARINVCSPFISAIQAGSLIFIFSDTGKKKKKR